MPDGGEGVGEDGVDESLGEDEEHSSPKPRFRRLLVIAGEADDSGPNIILGDDSHMRSPLIIGSPIVAKVSAADVTPQEAYQPGQETVPPPHEGSTFRAA